MRDDDRRDRVLVIGSSLETESDEVLRVGFDLARRLGARAIVVHSWEPTGTAAATLGLPADEAAWLEMRADDLRARLEAQVRRFEPPAGTETRLEAGFAADRLAAIAEEERAILVVTGAARAGLPHPLGLGSTPERLSRRGAVPLYVVRSAAYHPPRRALLPVDCSPLAGAGLRLGLPLLDALGIERGNVLALFLVQAVEKDEAGEAPRDRLERLAATEVGRFVRSEGGEGIAVEVRVGRAPRDLVLEIDRGGYDLALLATRSLTGLRRIVEGSVATGLLREAPSNLLVIPAAAVRGSRRAPVAFAV